MIWVTNFICWFFSTSSGWCRTCNKWHDSLIFMKQASKGQCAGSLSSLFWPETNRRNARRIGGITQMESGQWLYLLGNHLSLSTWPRTSGVPNVGLTVFVAVFVWPIIFGILARCTNHNVIQFAEKRLTAITGFESSQMIFLTNVKRLQSSWTQGKVRIW